MTSSTSQGDALILSGTNASIRGIIIGSLKIIPYSGIGLVSEHFYPSTYIDRSLTVNSMNLICLDTGTFDKTCLKLLQYSEVISYVWGDPKHMAYFQQMLFVIIL